MKLPGLDRIARLSGAILLAFALSQSAMATDVAQVYQSSLPNLSGKDFTVITVSYEPGEKSRPHRHGQAFVFAYVLEGSVRSQVEGEAEHVFKKGESWSEAPGAHHIVSGNASDTEPAKFLVVFVADPKAELSVTDPP
jgi:quercetin dioxygenase-like cupin family protein